MRTFPSIVGLLFVIAAKAWSFPQMTSHGYTSCVACHTAPSGGGLLTPYGRSLSREVLSTSSAENEELALYGTIAMPTWMQLGGDLRVLQNYISTSTFEEAKLVVMQADLEAGVVTERLQVVGTLGYQNPMSANATKSPLMSRRHFVQVLLGEKDYLRAGKFEMAYGTRWPDHFILSRRDLGWDEGAESYRAEWSRVEEKFELISSVGVGRPDAPELLSEKALSSRFGWNVGSASQIAWSGYFGTNDRGDRWVTGPAVAITPFERFMVFGQVDLQKLGKGRGDVTGLVSMLRVNYEVSKGLHFSVFQEYSKLNFNDDRRVKQAYTAAAQWFFRPHVEFAAGFRKQQASSTARFSDSAWVMMHYYL